MGTLTARQLIDRAETVLVDEGNVRWTEPEMLQYLNDAQMDAVILDPRVYVVSSVEALVSGTVQTLPLSAVRLIDAPRNMGVNQTTPGRAVIFSSRADLDKVNPYWHMDSADSEVINVLWSDNDPRRFFVYPPQPTTGTGSVELLYSAAPPTVTLNGAITVDDSYQTALVYYMVYRAHAKEVSEANQGKAALYKKLFEQAVLREGGGR